MGIICEGIGDIIFSVRSYYTHSFSLSEYLIQKSISVAFTLLTGGFGNIKEGFRAFKEGGTAVVNISTAFCKTIGEEIIERGVITYSMKNVS